MGLHAEGTCVDDAGGAWPLSSPPSQDGGSAIMEAASSGHVESVRALVELKADVNCQDQVRGDAPPRSGVPCGVTRCSPACSSPTIGHVT